MLFPLILALIFIIYALLSNKKADARQDPGSSLKSLYDTLINETSHASLLFSCVLSVSVLYVIYILFFHYSSILWSLGNRSVPLADYTPWTRGFIAEQDGIELYVLYALTFLSMIITFLTNNLFTRINNSLVVRSFFVLFGIISILFFANVHIYPPMAAPANGLNSAGFVILVLFVTLGLAFLFQNARMAANFILPPLIVPICMAITSGIAFNDYNYIFTPALKLIDGCKPGTIYFQYDYLLSLLAALWLRSGLGIYSFRILGQLSYLALFIGIYFFAQKYFTNKLYALLLLICLVIVRIYGQIFDPTSSFQVTPLRLDLWFILLLLAYWRGIKHWSVGLALGILLIIHHNFGMIYTGSYLLLISTLGIIEAFENNLKIKEAVKCFLTSYRTNIYILIVSLAAYQFLFKGYIPYNASTMYSFIPIAGSSLYWLVPIMLSLLVILIMNNRKLLAERYFTTSLFLIIVTVGNSLYFFGRSHENNLIHLSANLLFCLFLLFDILDLKLDKKTLPKIWKLFMPAVAIIFILTCSYYYSGRAIEKARLQSFYLKKWQFAETYPAPDMHSVHQLTRFSSNVIFLSFYDLWYYYYGGYVPQGNYHTYAWLIKKDLIGFLNNHLKKGYYVLIPDPEIMTFSEIIDGLRIKNRFNDSGFLYLTNNIGR